MIYSVVCDEVVNEETMKYLNQLESKQLIELIQGLDKVINNIRPANKHSDQTLCSKTVFQNLDHIFDIDI